MYAGAVYLAIAVIGGMVTLMGLFLLYRLAGTLSFSGLYEACQKMSAADRRLLYVSGFLTLFGFGAKAGMYPLHVWLPMAHLVAPAPPSALLSGIITKTGILGVIILSVYVFVQDAWWGCNFCVWSRHHVVRRHIGCLFRGLETHAGLLVHVPARF